MAEGGGEEHTAGAHTSIPDVFISYASQDAAVADAIVSALERQGLNCWIAPRDVTPGTHYASAIVHAIDAAKVIVLILSQNAAGSPHVLREVERATSKRRPVVSLRTDQAPLPAEFEYFLNTSQWLDASGGDIARAMPKLVAAVRIAIEIPATPIAAIAGTPATGSPMRVSSIAGGGQLRHRTAIVAGSLVAVAIAGFAAYRSWQSARPTVAPPAAALATATPAVLPAAMAIPEKSVAVLPFLDMSEKKDQEYFSDGLSEELIDMLTKVPELRVPARTSSFYFKDKRTTIAEIAKALGVAHVLEGSVRKSGNKLRITAQLIRADNGYHIWSETFDRTLDDIFKVQDEIADAVVKTLKLSLINDDPSEATAAPSNAAYLLFLQARALRHGLRDRKQAETIVSYLRQAVSLDPLFAPAWAELARALVYQSNNGYDSPDKVRADAHHAAEQALMHGQNLAIAHLSRGIVCFYLDWDWACADHAYRKALELDPRSPDIFVFLSGIPIVHGKIDEARTLLERAVELDPLDERYYQWLGDMAFYLRQFSEAEAEYRKSLAIHPGYDGISARLGAVEMSRGNLQAALELMERETDEESREWGLSLIYHELRRKTDADSALAELERRHGGDSAIDIAEIHAFRGEIDQAFSWLDRAFRQRADGIYAIKTDPWLQNLLPDPRFNALLKKMNLPQ